MSDYRCPRCAADPKPEHFGDPRQCAFDAEGNFTPENWNCATMDAILGPEPVTVHGSEERMEATPTRLDDGEDYGGFIVTCRHKNRGRTSSAIYVGDFFPSQPLTLALAERVIASRASYAIWFEKYGYKEPEE